MNNFPLSYPNARELLTAAERIQTILTLSPPPKDTVLRKLLANITRDSLILSRCLKIQRENQWLLKLENADILFNKSFSLFKHFCLLLSNQTNSLPIIAVSAAIIVDVIKSVNWDLDRYSYAQELSDSKTLCTQIEITENAYALKTCNAVKLYKSFFDAYTNLNTIYNEQIETEALNNPDCPDLKLVKTDMLFHIEQVCSYCAILENIDKSAYGLLYSRFHEIVNTVLPGICSCKTRKTDDFEFIIPEISDNTNCGFAF